MGDVTQTEAVTQVGAIAEQGGDAAIVRLEENFEDQASEQLGLGIEFGAEFVGIGAQNLSSDRQGLTGNVQGRFGKCAHTILYAATVPKVREVF